MGPFYPVMGPFYPRALRLPNRPFSRRLLQHVHLYLFGPLYPLLALSSFWCDPFFTPTFTNGALLPRDGTLLPSCPSVT